MSGLQMEGNSLLYLLIKYFSFWKTTTTTAKSFRYSFICFLGPFFLYGNTFSMGRRRCDASPGRMGRVGWIICHNYQFNSGGATGWRAYFSISIWHENDAVHLSNCFALSFLVFSGRAGGPGQQYYSFSVSDTQNRLTR